MADKPKRNAKGHFLKGNKESVGMSPGRPCEYCQNKDAVLKTVYLYQAYCEGELPDHKSLEIPYIEELCLKLKIHTDTLNDWCKGDCTQGDHSDIVRTIKGIMMMQKLRLLQRTNGNNPTGAIFQLKANHKMIEIEKKILAGDDKEPLEIHIVDSVIHE